jgi:hypothetical protein
VNAPISGPIVCWRRLHAEPDRIQSLIEALSTNSASCAITFADRLVSHLYDEEVSLVPVRTWIEEKLGVPLSDVIQREQRRQATDQVSVANIIGSLRALGQIDWRESFERLSLVEGILRGDALYTQMDFASRDEYRHEIERLARGVSTGKGESNAANADYAANEIAVATRAVEAARPNETSFDASTLEGTVEASQHVGYYLIDDGVKSLETALHYQPKLEQRGRRWLLDHPETAYLGATVLGTAGVTWAALSLARRFGARALGPLGLSGAGAGLRAGAAGCQLPGHENAAAATVAQAEL